MDQNQHSKLDCKYGNEAADLKLLLIYFIKRIRYVFYAVIAGVFLFAATYYLTTYVFADEQQYVVTGEFYLVYSDDVRLDNVYINDYTWQNLIKTDKAVEHAMTKIRSNVTEEYVRDSVTAGLVSDVRFVTLTVTANEPDLAIEIANAFQDTIFFLAEEMKDIDTVTVFTKPDSAQKVTIDDRTGRMAITGAVLGVVVSVTWIVLQYVFDDSVYVPRQFEQRYGIPVIGTCLHNKGSINISQNMIGQKTNVDSRQIWTQEALKINYEKYTEGCKKVMVVDTSVQENTDYPFDVLKDAKIKLEQEELLEIAMGDRKEEDSFFTADDYALIRTASVNEDAEVARECGKADGVVLMVQAGAHNGKLIERAIDLLEKQDSNIKGTLLYDGDTTLYRMYYFETILFGKANRKNVQTEEEEFFEDDLF